MTRLEQKLLAALRQLAERYAALGSAAKQTLERLLPELAALVAAIGELEDG